MGFLKRLGRAIADILTSKKALAAGAGIVAKAAGADDATVAMIGAYVLGQGISDHGKEAAKKKLPADPGADLAGNVLIKNRPDVSER